jgi:hypothetical protein
VCSVHFKCFSLVFVFCLIFFHAELFDFYVVEFVSFLFVLGLCFYLHTFSHTFSSNTFL